LQRLPIWLGNADETIRAHFTEPLALAEIAKRVKVHPVHLAREYRRYFNCTIGEQIRRLRVEYACEQLTTTDLSLADIALASGFSDQSHFSVRFKQQIGTAPSHYRQAVRTMVFAQNGGSAGREADA
jgi:AraC family transcriptional regulator